MDKLRKGANEVASILKSKGFEVYFAGGCVRDLLLGRTPKDYDLVTDAHPDQVDALFKKTVMVGASFGVVRVLWKRQTEYEIATYRQDGAYSDGRRPDDVQYSKSKEEDVKRRDFTINALLMDPVSDEIFDFVEGKADLESGVIRTVGSANQRFHEDRLRMLRAVRFASRFDFIIEPSTLTAIKEYAERINDVSIERVVQELHGIWSSPGVGLGTKLLQDTNLLNSVCPFLSPEVCADISTRYDAIWDSCNSLELEAQYAVAWALIFENVPEIELEEKLRRFKLSNTLTKKIFDLLRERHKLLRPSSFSTAERIRLLVRPDFALFLAYLHTIDGRSSPASEIWSSEQDELLRNPLPKMPILSGGDLTKMGYEPGPVFKRILGAVEDEVFERRIESASQARKWVSEQSWS